jgi:predicted lipopolysaccharide heptosyltransferase III
VNRILLVRLREIGDVVFTTPAIRAIRRRFPTARITYIVEPHAAAIVEHNPHIDHLIVAPRVRGVAGVLADVRLGRTLRTQQFDLAIDFHGGPRASLLTWLSGARERVGYEIAGRGWMYTRRVARPRELRPRHSVENQWDLLLALGFEPPEREHDAVEMAVDPAAVDRVAARLAQPPAQPDDRLIVIHVSAGNPFRRWPLDHFVALTTALAGHPGIRIVLSSGPSERAAAGEVVSRTRASLGPESGAAVLDCGEFSLAELRALIDRASLFIGGDSGPLHIASTTGVPVVALFGPTLPERSMPWRSTSFPAAAVDAGTLPCRPCDQRVCAPGDFRCLARIPPERVVEAALRLVRGQLHRA